VLYYDSQTETFWSQMTGEAVVGPLTGRKLGWLAGEVTTWGAWRRKHPKTTALRPEYDPARYTATARYYDVYRDAGRPMFPMDVEIDPKYGNMELLTIVRIGGKARGYPHAELKEGITRDGDLTVEKRGISVVVKDAAGKPLPAMSGYWFAWCAFYRDNGTVYERPAPSKPR